jgi:hypothetical protein
MRKKRNGDGWRDPEAKAPAAAGAHHHPLVPLWLRFSPSLRDRSAGGHCLREISCGRCGEVLGSTDDPVDAFFMGVVHRRASRRMRRAENSGRDRT